MDNDVPVLNILPKLNEWRKAGITSDVTHIINEQEFYAHKYILAAAIEFFEKLFLSDFAEKNKNIITLKDVDPNGFRLILDYIYTKEIKIDDGNFEQVLSIAFYYQIECLVKKLFDYVKSNVNTDSSFFYYCSADSVGAEEIKGFLKEFIRKDFLSCSDSAAFLDTTHPVLLEFIDSPITGELNRFKVVMKWIQYDLDNRSDYLLDLIKHVRFGYISNDEVIHDIFDYQLVINNLEIIKTIKERIEMERTMWIYGMNGSDLIRVGIVNAKVVAAHVMVKVKMNYNEFQIGSTVDAIYVSLFNKKMGSWLYRFKDSEWKFINHSKASYPANRSILYSEKHNAVYSVCKKNICCFNFITSSYFFESGYQFCGTLVYYNDFFYTIALCPNNLYWVAQYDPYNGDISCLSRVFRSCSDVVNAILDDKMFIISNNVVQTYDFTKNECEIIVVNVENCISYHSLISYQNRLYAIRKTWDVIDVFDPFENNWTEKIDLKINDVSIFNKT